jgi:hypothetical protein
MAILVQFFWTNLVKVALNFKKFDNIKILKILV